MATTADESRERRVRVSGREGEEVVWSRKAARRAGRLTNWLDDLNPSEDTIFPVEETCATVLRTLGAMCDDDWSASCLDECSPTQLATLIEGANNLLAEQALEYTQTAFACRLDGKCANELRELLGVVDDFESDEERVAALAEPAFTPDSPMPQLTAAAALPVNDDAAEAALGKVGVAMLIELKGVDRAWRALGRRALCSRLCRREGHADPRQLHEITELNLELLIEAGRPWEAVRAGRLLLHLERLTGYGFSVDVAAVREVDLEDEGEEEEDRGHVLHGPAKHALCNSCVTGEGEPPLALLLGAIACAGSGYIRGIPVEQMRADALTNIDVHDQRLYGIGPEGAILIASFIPVMGGLTSINMSGNNLTDSGDMTGIKELAAALGVNGALTCVDVRSNNITGDGAAQLSAAVLGNLKIEMFNGVPIKEMRANSLTELDLKWRGVGVEGGMVVAGLIPVMIWLTELYLDGNRVGDEGVGAICKAIQSNKETKLALLNFGNIGIGPVGANTVAAMVAVTGGLTSLDLSENALCGVTPMGGTYTAEGITAIADALRMNGALTKINLSRNCLGAEGAAALARALAANGGLTSLDLSSNQLCGLDYHGRGTYTAEGITAIADALRVNGGLTSLNLSDNQLCGLNAIGKGTYAAEGITAIADALRVNGGLTVTNLLRNQLDAESAKLLAEVAKQKGISLCGIRRDQTTADFSYQNLKLPDDAILLASDLSQAVVTGGLTALDLSSNDLKDEGVSAVCKAIQSNKETKLASLNFKNNGISPGGANAVASMVAVTGALTV